MSTLETFIELLQKNGLEYFSSFFGTYRAVVSRNDDPQGRGRIQVAVPIAGSAPMNVWIDPLFKQTGNDRGEFCPPEVKDSVFICFDRGLPETPLAYFGGVNANGKVPAEFAGTPGKAENPVPEVRGFITRMGHRLLFSDKAGSEFIRIIWHKADPGDPANSDRSLSADRTSGDSAAITFEPDGSVVLVNKNGSLIQLDATNNSVKIVDENGNLINMTPDGISVVDSSSSVISMHGGKVEITSSSAVTINAPSLNAKTGGVFLGDQATFSGVLGEQLIAYLAAHVHLTAFGPSSPPVPPPTPALISKSVKLKM